MRVIGVDPSLAATAYCVLEDGNREPVELTTIKYPKTVGGDWRLQHVFERLVEVIIEHGVERAVIESLPGAGTQGTVGPTGMMSGACRLVMMSCEVPYVTAPPSSLKKYASGKGNATKPDMRMALFQRLGMDLRDDNQVDAFFLAALGHEHLGTRVVEMPKVHLAALDPKKIDWTPWG